MALVEWGGWVRLQWRCPGDGLVGSGAGWRDREAPNYCSMTASLSKNVCLVQEVGCLVQL